MSNSTPSSSTRTPAPATPKSHGLAGELTFTSDYLTDAFYDDLLRFVGAGASLGPSLGATSGSDLQARAECEALLYQEARLMDERRYADWLTLYTRQCLYWIPFDDRADPRNHVNLAFDDRRRLEDRLLRLQSGYAHTLKPDRRFQHLVTAVEAWQLEPDRRRVQSSQVVYEYRPGHEVAQHLFRADHLLVREAGAWRIAIKRCVLVQRDAAIEPPTLL